VSNTFAGTDRFELVRRLGEGGFGTVYEAFDRKRPARVALKVLRHAEGRALYRFKREFRSLADISHPNLVALGELLTDGWHWFFTMELVPGEPMVAHLRRRSGPGDLWEGGRHAAERFDEVRLRRVLPQLADALHTIHRAGIVHCDIKPSNVLVTPEDHVVVLDFGLVSEHPEVMAADSSAPSSLVVVGTPSYMAPEQAMGEQATPAADWYSVGVMLYEVLTGQLPFSGSKFEVIDAKKHRTPSPPAELNSAAPDDLAQLTMELLDINPERRPTGETVLSRVGRPALRARAAFPRRAVSEVFLGRESLSAGRHPSRSCPVYRGWERRRSSSAF
jgi:eukaryotic-like serine/threonine-protein kinase